MLRKGVAFLFAFLNVISIGVFADTTNPCKISGNYWQNSHGTGWFWYRECRPKKLIAKKKQKNVRENIENKSYSSLLPTSPDEQKYVDLVLHHPELLRNDKFLSSLNYQQFRQLYDTAVGEAALKQDPELAHDVVYLTNFLRERSLNFAYNYNLFAVSNPKFNIAGLTGTGNWGWRRALAIKIRYVRNYIRDHSEHIGLYYFFSAYCPYCREESPIIQEFADEYGVNVLGISKDECAGEVSNCVVRPDLFDKFGISETPTIVLVYKNGSEVKFVPVGSGLTSETQLRDRVFQFLHIIETGKPEDWTQIQ